MSTHVKRTISFSDSTLLHLEDLVPKSKRSRFVDQAVSDALLQIAKEQALDNLSNFARTTASGKNVVDTLADIRQTESARLQ